MTVSTLHHTLYYHFKAEFQHRPLYFAQFAGGNLPRVPSTLVPNHQATSFCIIPTICLPLTKENAFSTACQIALVAVVSNSSPYEGADTNLMKEEHVIPVIFAIIAGITKINLYWFVAY